MEPKGATDIAVRNRNYNIKPAQVVDAHASDEDNDFPEFEFPVTNGASTLDAWKAVSTIGGQPTQTINGNSTWGFLQPGGLFSDESPKKMPLAFRSKNGDAVPEQNPFFPSLIAEAPVTNSKPQILSPLATFKNLDVSLDNGKVDAVEEKSPAVPSTPTLKISGIRVTSDSAAVPSTPTRKSLSAASRASSDLTAPPSTPASKSLSKLQADLARTPERVKSGALSASAVSGKTSGGVRSFALTTPRGRDEATRPVSPTPDRRSLTSPRRLVPERSRSPVPFQTPDRVNSGVSRSLSPSPRSITPTRASLRAPVTPRSTSPVPTRSQSSNLPKEQWNGNTTRSVSMPNSPRYITPTRAASLKAVKTPATPNGTVAKELQYSPAPGAMTPRSDPVKKAPREAHAKISDDGHPTLKVRTSPPLTQPSGFNFKTDERSEKRRDFYSKLEERMKAKEEERKKLEAKAQEEKEAQLKELRKSLGYKANPVPKFYQEPPPPPVEIKRSPPTRARSPNFTAPRRRESCMGSFSESTSSSGSSPLRSRLVRSPSLESNSGSHSSHVSHSHSARVSAAPKENMLDREREHC
ncbi:hypothetical protein KC19_8G023400 [Ceratodon purpureus]|uniref:TPX2 C-terminal domain-containing protein n=1 Tax=Ceratodon purpureus TaxID=3225 RepID=A0A8T0GZY4_CERPU|nr:hypothetical protein KC19_8G023400 [Ceratodon purpureus]